MVVNKPDIIYGTALTMHIANTIPVYYDKLSASQIWYLKGVYIFIIYSVRMEIRIYCSGEFIFQMCGNIDK